MSDFDKEAERKKLEERFAEEEEERETTERMSELLLQGATMTDTHCNECGDPLFRYDGQTFCPTCQRPAGDAETAEETPEAPSAVDATSGQGQPVADRDERTADGRNGQAADPRPQRTETSERDPQQPSTEGRRAPPARDMEADETGSVEPAPSDGTTADLAAAEASLTNVLRQQTATAERTDDLGRARDHLAAAREAADALDALRRARR